MTKAFKTAASLKIKPAGVASYMARKAIADWLHNQADQLLVNHRPAPGGHEATYNYAGPKVEGGEMVFLES